MTEAKPENEQASYDPPFVEPAGNPPDAPPAGTEPPEEELDDGSMSLIAHLTELRSRLIKCLVAVALGSCVGYYFLDEIMHYLTAPAGKLYYMQPSEAFFTYLKVSIAAGFLVALPVIFYQVWMFFLPALTRRERMVLGLIVPASVLLFFGGLAFSFFLVFPAAVSRSSSYSRLPYSSSSASEIRSSKRCSPLTSISTSSSGSCCRSASFSSCRSS